MIISTDEYEKSLKEVQEEHDKIKRTLIKKGEDPKKADIKAIKMQIDRYRFMLDMECPSW